MLRARAKAADLLRRFRTRSAAQPAGIASAIWQPEMRAVFHEARPAMRESFISAGHRESHFFPHRVHWLPRCGPDGFVLARDMCGVRDVTQLWHLVLFATSPALDEFPPEIFFDRDLIWHQQHFGRPGQVASVDLAADGAVLYTMAHQSDLVQRISRWRDVKTRVEKVFKGWHHLLLNAIADFAVERGFQEIRVPTSALAMRHTDPRRRVLPELFERVYDRAVQHLFDARERDGWWCINVAAHRAAIVPLVRGEETLAPGRTVCICHDVERGHGHRLEDPEFARRCDAEAPAALERMLAVEQGLGVGATYNVVGCFLDEVRRPIESPGHALAFHSFDHGPDPQLARCRKVDYRIKGYRVPQSRLTDELRDERLYSHNVEWLASSPSSLGVTTPSVVDRMAKIPIALDDYPLHKGTKTYAAWRENALQAVNGRIFTAIGLHDCYATHWLHDYERFLEELMGLAHLRTMDEVASMLYLAAGT